MSILLWVQIYSLILKADAIKTLGLKTITAKHLALASEVVSCAMQLLLSIKEKIAPMLLASQKVPVTDFMYVKCAHESAFEQGRLAEFATVQQDLLSHKQEIFAKLTAIMDDVWLRSVKV